MLRFIGGQQTTKILSRELYHHSKEMYNTRKLYIWRDMLQRGFNPEIWGEAAGSVTISFKAIYTPEEKRIAEDKLKQFERGIIMKHTSTSPVKAIINELKRITPASEALIRAFENDIKKDLTNNKPVEDIIKKYSGYINTMYKADGCKI